MSIDKTSSIILSVAPYRESSYLVTLFSRGHGRLGCIAKGLRRNDRRSVPLERGSLIEHTLYHKPNRDLHQITDCSIVEFFSDIRSDLEKTALRDLIIDILLASLSISDCNEELFITLNNFLNQLNLASSKSSDSILVATQALLSIAGSLGFSPELSCCSSCGAIFGQSDRTFFSIGDGTLRCTLCTSHSTGGHTAIPYSNITLLHPSTTLHATNPEFVSTGRALSLLWIAVDYCRYHFDIRKKLSSLSFIEQLFTLPVHTAASFTTVQKHLLPIHNLTTKETTCQTLP